MKKKSKKKTDKDDVELKCECCDAWVLVYNLRTGSPYKVNHNARCPYCGGYIFLSLRERIKAQCKDGDQVAMICYDCNFHFMQEAFYKDVDDEYGYCPVCNGYAEPIITVCESKGVCASWLLGGEKK